MLKNPFPVLPQVNKNCFQLSLVPTLDPGVGDLYIFGNSIGTVEANIDLLTYYNVNVFPATQRNFLEAFQLRFGFRGVIINQNGTLGNGNTFFTNYLVNKKLKVVKTVLTGQMFGFAANTDPRTGLFLPFDSYPVDVWHSNGVGTTLKVHSLETKRYVPNDDIALPRSGVKIITMTSDEVYEVDSNTVFVVPYVATDQPAVPIYTLPGFVAQQSQIATLYNFGQWMMLTIYFEDESYLYDKKNFTSLPFDEAKKQGLIQINENLKQTIKN